MSPGLGTPQETLVVFPDEVVAAPPVAPGRPAWQRPPAPTTVRSGGGDVEEAHGGEGRTADRSWAERLAAISAASRTLTFFAVAPPLRTRRQRWWPNHHGRTRASCTARRAAGNRWSIGVVESMTTPGPGPKQVTGQRRASGGEIKEFKGLAAASADATGPLVEPDISGYRRFSARSHAWSSGQVPGGARALGRGAAGRTRTNGGTVALSTFFDARA